MKAACMAGAAQDLPEGHRGGHLEPASGANPTASHGRYRFPFVGSLCQREGRTATGGVSISAGRFG